MTRWDPYQTRNRLPLVEGMCPPVYDAEKGEYVYPEPDPDYEDPELKETDTYEIMEKEEFYNYVTKCKSCGAEFIAYIKHGQFYVDVRNFCPGCGKRLEEKEDGEDEQE